MLFFLAVAGCAPREAFFRPAEGRAIGRDGLVGVRLRVPPDAPDAEAAAVVALSAMQRSREPGDRAELVAVIEFRNKREGSIVFLPGTVLLSGEGLAAVRPAVMTRGSRPAAEAEEIPHWHEARFVARFDLPADAALRAKSLTLAWSCRYGGGDCAQATRFTATDRRLAERSTAGYAPGLEGGAYSSRESGVPFLMDIPFLGFFFRSSSRSVSRSSTDLSGGPAAGASAGAGGAWWALEP